MKNLIAILFFLGPLFLFAQEMPTNIDLGIKNRNTFISSTLLKVAQPTKSSFKRPVEIAREQSLVTRADEKIYVEIIRGSVTDVHKAIDLAGLEKKLNIRINNTYGNRATAWVSPARLLEIADKLPEEYHIEEVSQMENENQGPVIMNSATYQGNGLGGEGIKIAIIDTGYEGLTLAQQLGRAPANYESLNLTPSTMQAEGNTHGRLCVETAFDHAPNAEYLIVRVNGYSDLGVAVEVCIDQGVDIISYSQSAYNTGWGDNTGIICAAANRAVDAGMLFFTAAGNRNGVHLQEHFRNPDGDRWHNFGSGDEQNDFTVAAGGIVRGRLQWNSSSTEDHYDLFLYENGTNRLLASSTNTNGFESFNYTSEIERDVYFAIRANTDNPPMFELFNHEDDCTNFEFASTSGSTTSPSNSTRANVISVGAVEVLDYDEPSGVSGITADYSSIGPTNSGNMAPDIVSPTLTGVGNGGSFSGTSCSTPNAAGMAAAFWSAHPYLSNDGVRRIILRKAELYKDWGATGPDNVYGHGGLYLYDYHRKNRYIYHRAGNLASDISLPYFSAALLDNSDQVADDRIMVHLDEEDQFTSQGPVLKKPMLYKSIDGTLIKRGVQLTFTQQEEEAPVELATQFEPIDFTRPDATEKSTPKVDPFSLFPNPVFNRATVSYNLQQEGEVVIQILDVNGRVVKMLENQIAQTSGNHQVQLNTNGMEPGTYFCRLQTSTEEKVVKFVVSQ